MGRRTERIHYSGNGESLLYLNFSLRDIVLPFSRSQYPFLNVKKQSEGNLCQIVPPGLKFNHCKF